jgi:multidrug efflux pump subunit AcrA (membrane-fusion protein)
MPLRRRTLLINGALVVVLAGVAVVGWSTLASGSSTSTGRTATVHRGTVLATVAATGTVTSPGDVGVSFSSTGRVTRIDVAVGDKVRKGQVLATIDDLSARQALASARGALANAQNQLATAEGTQTPTQAAQASAAVTQAQSQVDSAQRTLSYTRSANALSATGYDRSVASAQTAYDQAVSAQRSACRAGSSPACSAAKQATTQEHQQLQSATLTRRQNLLRDSKSLADAQAQVTSARQSLSSTQAQNAAATEPESALQLAAAKAQVDSAQAQVEAAEIALTATTLRAPAAGTVASIAGKVGEAASDGSSSNGSSTSTASDSATGFIVLTGVAKLQVQASFSEADTASVKKGAGASVSFEALTGVTANARVVAIAPLPTTTNGVTSYTVTLDMLAVPRGVRAGQSTTVTVTAAEATNVLYVPSAAVTSLGGVSTITVKSAGGSTRTVNVTVGLKGDTNTQISGDGVTEGATVVIPTATTGTTGFPTGVVPGGGGFGGGGFTGGTGRTR